MGARWGYVFNRGLQTKHFYAGPNSKLRIFARRLTEPPPQPPAPSSFRSGAELVLQARRLSSAATDGSGKAASLRRAFAEELNAAQAAHKRVVDSPAGVASEEQRAEAKFGLKFLEVACKTSQEAITFTHFALLFASCSFVRSFVVRILLAVAGVCSFAFITVGRRKNRAPSQHTVCKGQRRETLFRHASGRSYRARVQGDQR